MVTCFHKSLTIAQNGRVLFGLLVLLAMPPALTRAADTDSDRIEFTFELPQIQGNPFDFTANDVRVTISDPVGNTFSIPAFFDGGKTWKVRHSPDSLGRYSVRSVTLNGTEIKPFPVDHKELDFSGPLSRGFVRIDSKDPMRFAFDDRSPFYPVGYNLAWRQQADPEMPPLVDSLDRMGRAGVNWSRIWMNYWDGKNLDWPLDKTEQLEPGTLLLPVAHTWDAIVETAQKNQIYFQMVLQHHGQYSSKTDPNWQINPWNKANGGWLEFPEQFFTDPRAIQLTKNKFRYIVARWGYSPSIMAFELCNEVESTDGFKKDLPSVADWHQKMAQFIREQDHYKHLITTSSETTQKTLWPAMDYYQAHAYPSDLISAIAGLDDQKLTRPYFYGEMGGSSSGAPQSPRDTLHRILWASLMSGSAGTGQYWDWFDVEPRNLLGQFTAVQEFIKQSGLLNDRELHPTRLDAQTPLRGPLVFGPGRDWATSTTTHFSVNPNGTIENVGGMSAFLQGRGTTHPMFPLADFDVNYPEPGTFAIQIDQLTPAGARIEASLDSKPMASLVLGRNNDSNRRPGRQSGTNQNTRLNATLELPIPAGQHTIRLENAGDDWVHIHQFALTPYSPELAALGKTSKEMAILWVYRRSSNGKEQPLIANIEVDELTNGTYRVVWWDTDSGKIIKESTAEVASGKPLAVITPPVDQDIACWIVRSTQR